MRVRELITKHDRIGLKVVRPMQTLLEAAQVLTANNIGALPVVGDSGNLTGIVSERDLVRSVARHETGFFEHRVADVMTTSVITCHPDDFTDEVYDRMCRKKVRHIPVVEHDKLFSMLSLRDFEEAYRLLRKQSLTDELTGVHNRRHFSSILDNEFNRFRRFHAPLSVAAIKIDRLAELRASKGHAAADAVLKKLGEALVEQTRTYDGIGRIAEDVFGVVFPNTESKTANRACERLLTAVRNGAGGLAVGTSRTSISIGMAIATRECSDAKGILGRALELAQLAADAGGDCVESDMPVQDATGRPAVQAETERSVPNSEKTLFGA